MQRPNHDPWRVTLLYEGDLTAAVLEQARQGRVCTINASLRKLHPAEAERVVTDLLGAGGSLQELDLSGAGLKGTWAAIFGDAPVSSAVLRALYLNPNPNPNPNPNFNLNLNPNRVKELAPQHGSRAEDVLLFFQDDSSGYRFPHVVQLYEEEKQRAIAKGLAVPPDGLPDPSNVDGDLNYHLEP